MLFFIPQLTKMFQFSWFPSSTHPPARNELYTLVLDPYNLMDQEGSFHTRRMDAGNLPLRQMGFPIRKSSDQGMFGSSPKRIARLLRPSSVFHAKASSIYSYEKFYSWTTTKALNTLNIKLLLKN